MDNVILEINGENYTGWQSVSIQRTMESLCGTFTVDLVDESGTTVLDIGAGTPCKVFIQDSSSLTPKYDQIISGYVDGIKLRQSATATGMTIQGRDITLDLIDCAAILKSSTITKARFSDIVKQIVEPFGIIVDTSQLTIDDKIEKFTLQNGESAYSAIERLCRSQAVLPLTDEEGNLLLTYAAKSFQTADEDLELGRNILDITKNANWKDRFLNYEIRGQRSGNGKAWDGRITQMVATAEDPEIDRYRPFTFMSENKASDNNLQNRVNWEAQVRAGRSVFYNVSVKGWHQLEYLTGNRRPWAINERVNLKSGRWAIDEQQLITAVSFTLSQDSGKITKLVLKNPDVYKPNPTPKVELK
jgi:prophage tail gpP-like protein